MTAKTDFKEMVKEDGEYSAGRVALGALSVLLLAWFSWVARLYAAVFDFLTAPFESMSATYAGLVAALGRGAALQWFRGAEAGVAEGVTAFGPFSFVVAVVIVLAMFYVLGRGVDRIA